MPIQSARRMVPIRLIGVGLTLANNGSSVAVPIPNGANAFYCTLSMSYTLDGTPATANSINQNVNAQQPILIPQGAELSIFGTGVPTYIQFCQVSC